MADERTVEVASPWFRFWPRARVEHSAAKQTYVNPPVFAIVRLQRI